MTERIAFIVDKLNAKPFNKGLATMTDLDSKSSLELLDYACEIVVSIDPDQTNLLKEATEIRIQLLLKFLMVHKFNIQEDQVDEFQSLLEAGDVDVLHTIMHWCLQRYDHLKKRAYLSKYLMPVEVPPDFMNEDLVIDLSARLKEIQVEFKEVHKTIDQLRNSGTRPTELKAEISTLEDERKQLSNKIAKMKRDSQEDEGYFQEMLKVTSALRKEQEEEVRIHEKLREHRKNFQDVDARLQDSSKRLNELRTSGIQNQSAEQLLAKLQKDVRELADKKESLESNIAEREQHLVKLQSWEKSDRVTTEDDVRQKRDQVHDAEDQVAGLQERLDAALERNTKLTVFRQASTMAMKKLREKEEEVDRLTEDKRRVLKQIEDKENELKASGKLSGNKMGKQDLNKYTAVVRQKIEQYKKMRDELNSCRAELVILQRSEQILKSRHKNLDEFLSELEKKKGVQGYRETQRQLIEMSEKVAEVDQMKGATLDQISLMVDQIGKEFKVKQSQLQPLMSELKSVRQEFMDFESDYMEKKATYDKVAMGLEMEKHSLEQECDSFQEECLREESRYHHLNCLVNISRIKLDRAEQEKKWQSGDGQLIRDFASLKDLYTNKLTQQEQMTKQLRKKQKELKENSGVMTNQKTNFLNLQNLLNIKMKSENGTLTSENNMIASPKYSGGNRYVQAENVKANSLTFN